MKHVHAPGDGMGLLQETERYGIASKPMINNNDKKYDGICSQELETCKKLPNLPQVDLFASPSTLAGG